MVFKIRVSSPIEKYGGVLLAVWAFLLPSGVFITPKLWVLRVLQKMLGGMERKLLRRRARRERMANNAAKSPTKSVSSSRKGGRRGYWFEGVASSQSITSAATNSDDQDVQKYEGPTIYQDKHELALPYPPISDATEGIAAFESLFKLGVFRDCEGAVVLNLGGGAFDHGPKWLEERVPTVKVLTADPFCRSYEHNRSVQAVVESSTDGVEIVLSISVLNVIEGAENRIAHLKLAHSVLKKNGGAFYAKVWAGMWPERGTGKSEADKCRNTYQGNKWAADYLYEVRAVFGADNCFLDSENSMLVAVRR